jgi:hypothetical protein
VDEKGTVLRKNGWGELAPEEWRRYLRFQRVAPPSLCQYCASYWNALQKQNAPLRAMLNGQLHSVSETIYDDFILREIAEEGEEFLEAKVIGQVLGKYHLGIGDAWLGLRIEAMIQAGALQVVTKAAEGDPSYHRILKSTTQGRITDFH